MPPCELSARCRAWRAIPLPLICTLLASCAAKDHRRTATPPLATVPPEIRVGVVRAVGAEQRFVLIETPSALATSRLTEGQVLHCRPPDAAARTATADVRVSHERHESLIVANVVAGEPAIGAIVYSTLDPKPTADSISSVSTAPLPGLSKPRDP